MLCRWNAWRQAKEHYLRSELGDAIRVCAVDNDELSKTNHIGERILLNGEPWVPQLVEHILEAKVNPPPLQRARARLIVQSVLTLLTSSSSSMCSLSSLSWWFSGRT